MVNNNFKVGDVVTYMAIGKVVQIFGNEVHIRDMNGKKYRTKVELLRYATQGQKEQFENTIGAIQRHQHWLPK